MRFFGKDYNFNFLNLGSKVVTPTPEEAKRKNLIPFKQQLQRIRQDVSTWRHAVTVAESNYNPIRRLLYQTYQDVVLDGHLSGLMDTRKNIILSKDFVLKNEAGEIDEEKTNQLKEQWFYDFLGLSFDSIYYGYSLIQFGDQTETGFKDVQLIPRQYVRPETSEVIPIAAPIKGISYLDEPFNNWLIGVGKPRDLGLLMKATPYVLWKKNTISSWAEHAEIFGMPMRIGRTDVRDDVTRTNMENMVANLGSSNWAVMDTDDAIELIERKASGDPSKIYSTLIELSNKELSKLIVGQTMTNDDGSSRSQSEVHERVLTNISEGDARYIESVVNCQLLPMLKEHGFNYEGLTGVFDERDSLTLQDQKEIDIALLNHYKIDPEYFLNKYGTPVEEKEVVEAPNLIIPPVNNDIGDKLKKLYS